MPAPSSTELFIAARDRVLPAAGVILDIGCGRGVSGLDPQVRGLFDLRAIGRWVIGIDVDPVGHKNSLIDEFAQIESTGLWPIADSSVDLAVSDWVLEHVPDPRVFISELSRVIKPGGAFVARTVNRWSYPALAASLVPNRLHGVVIEKMQPNRIREDVFPTTYQLNTRSALERYFRDDGFDVEVTEVSGGYTYFRPGGRAYRWARSAEDALPGSLKHTLIVQARASS